MQRAQLNPVINPQYASIQGDVNAVTLMPIHYQHINRASSGGAEVVAEFIMLMKGSGKAEDWTGYIDKLIRSGTFRGGSELAEGP